MQRRQHPMAGTIVYGAVCAAAFIPALTVLGLIMSGAEGLFLTVGGFSIGYALLLCRWGRRSLWSIALPLVLFGLAGLAMDSLRAFIVCALMALGWIRSGVCFQLPAGIRQAAEPVLLTAGILPLVLFPPQNLLGGALALWAFFLIQAGYFAILAEDPDDDAAPAIPDPFDHAHMKAEGVLARWADLD